MKRILVLFPKEWDRLEFERPEYRDRYEFVYAGFDLFRFPSNAQLATFDVFRFVNRLLERFRHERLDGVFSNNEYFGALIAAVLAEKLGLPGNDPRVVITAQHKYYARRAFERIAPQSAARFAAFPYGIRRREELDFELPCFVKPVRATFSVLARRVDSFEELRRHLAFWPFEKWVIQRIVKPFNDLMRWYTDFELDAHHLIAEEILEGVQVSMDGYVHGGRAHVLGIIDENMYPGTCAFRSFEYPSQLPEAVRSRMIALAAELLSGLGYRHGFFNLEFCWNPDTGRISVIELNPRMASQLSYLYECVDGVRPYEMLLALAAGEAPPLAAAGPCYGHAASFALRKFDGKPLSAHPSASQIARVRDEYPEAHLMLYLKRGASLAREMKWMGSYRYAVVNMAARTQQELYARFRSLSRQLFPLSDLPV